MIETIITDLLIFALGWYCGRRLTRRRIKRDLNRIITACELLDLDWKRETDRKKKNGK